jgi:hypothetical protein
MRALVLLALVALAAPLAGAQATGSSVSMTVEPFPREVEPLGPPVVVNFTITFSCLSADPPRPATASVHVETPPAFTAVASPASFAAPQGCLTNATLPGVVKIAATADAPAHVPETATLVATSGSASGRATFQLTAAYFSILDVNVPQAVAAVSPGGTATYVLSLTNLGNAKTRVHVAIGNASPGLAVDVPDDVTLDSKQQGGVTPSVAALVHVTARRTGTVDLVVEASDALTHAAGDVSHVSLETNVRLLASPAPSPLVLAPALAVALALVRWSRRSRAS